jgi:hypothetical protein
MGFIVVIESIDFTREVSSLALSIPDCLRTEIRRGINLDAIWFNLV